MEPERWRQVEQIYLAALEKDPSERPAFIDSACGSDQLLRREVESLLEQLSSTGGLIQSKVWASAAGLETRTILMPGEKLGPYQIVGPLGEGGMGTVYRGMDTRLNRPVAIKISNQQFSQRFEREARAISMLNHPHICTLYDVGPNYIVTELVEGETLREWLKRAPEPEKAIEVARQVLEALRAAHAAGIVHRDLKPANIMVRFDGYVKVLDFGLAKRISSSQVLPVKGVSSTDITLPGQVAGTAAYMSPEQIQGQGVDQRSDLFSFGILLYELLVGKHPWPRKSTVDTLHAILHDDPAPIPPISCIGPDFTAIIERLLEKDPAQRYPLAEAVLEDLADCGKRPVSSSRLRARPAVRARWRLAVIGLLFAAVTIASWKLWPRDSALRVREMTRVTSDDGLTIEPSLSRDGKMLAYASDRAGGPLNIWVQQVGGGEPLQITKDIVDDSEPSFSPDGTTIAFHSQRDGGGVYVVPALGGTPRRIADGGRRPRFSPDGEWLAYWLGEEGVFSRNKIYVVSAKGGEPRQLAATFLSADYPVWSPDGKHVLFVGAESDKKQVSDRYDWWVAPLDGSPPISTGILADLTRNNVFPILRQPSDWVGDSILLAASNQTYGPNTLTGVISQLSIWRQRISPNVWHAQGKPEQLTAGTDVEEYPVLASEKLALATNKENLGLWALPLDVETGRVKGELELAHSSPANNNYPMVSQDGSQLAFVSDDGKHQDIYERDLRTGIVYQLTKMESFPLSPFPNANGSTVFFYVWKPNEKPSFTFWEVSAPGGTPRQVCRDCDGSPYYWSKDEKKVIYYKSASGGPGGSLVVHDLESGKETPFAFDPKYEVRLPRPSPDEKWVAFQTVVSQTQRRMFIAPIRNWRAGSSETWMYIPEARAPAAWSPSGNLLYFLSDRDGFRCIWAQRLDRTTRYPLGAAFAVKHLHTGRRTLSINVEVASIGLTLASDRLIFSMPEHTGNVWMAQVDGRP